MYNSRMTKTAIAAVVLSLGLAACDSDDVKTVSNFDAVDTTSPVDDWQLVWSDEFTGTRIDPNKWTFEVDCRGGGNQERQCYTDNPENAYVSDGTLKIVALPADEDAEQPFTSARLNTRHKADFKYGRIEVRARMPHGQGTWPAVWMMPTDAVYGGWPKSGEIDIVEAVNLGTLTEDGEVETRVYGTLHYGRDAPNNSYSGKPYTLPNGANPADGFHTYAIEWQEGEIRWYVDGYLYQTQTQSLVRLNSRGETVGLRHRGWFAEFFNQATGDLEVVYGPQPFDQKFHIIMNLAVGGNWPENVNELGIDDDAFVDGQVFEIDYVRVYQCGANPHTGRGCDTIRAGYKDEETLVQGEAPIPSPPSDGVPRNLTIFDGTPNPNWPAWDCCGGSTPELVEDEDVGGAYRFVVGENPTVNGFISRSAFITDPAGVASPFDASPILETGSVSFDIKVLSQPNAESTWLFKIESNEGSTDAELPLSASQEGVAPVTGEWQTVTYSLQELADLGLDVSAIDVIMVFPAWGTGDGAEYLLANVEISAPLGPFPRLTLFADGEANPEWAPWDCCGGSTPAIVDDEDRGPVVEFAVGEAPTVMGFKPADGSGIQFDATALLVDGVVQFDMKIVDPPTTPDALWLFKIESDGAATEVELPLSAGNAGNDPVVGEWQTYTFSLQSLSDLGLDVSAIDVVMIFPAWGSGNGAVYRVDEARIYNPSEGMEGLTIFENNIVAGWSLWDCCAGTEPQVVMEDEPYGAVAQFEIPGWPETVLGFLADEGVSFDASNLVANGAVSFDMRIVQQPAGGETDWFFKIESTGAATAVELPLSAGNFGQTPVTGEWARYTFSLQDLFDAGLDLTDINVIMVFPAWGSGQGVVYQIDNVTIANF